MTNELTILHVLAPAHFGGLESVVRLLATGHQARGHRVIIAANTNEEHHPFVEALAESGVDVRRFHASIREMSEERRFVAKVIQDEVVTVVNTHGYRPNILDIPVARKLGVASVATLHGFTGGDWKVRLYERLDLRSIRKADAVVAVSTGVAARAERHGVHRSRLHLLRNAYAPVVKYMPRDEARRSLKLASGQTHIAWIGRLSHEKGPDQMIEAFALLNDGQASLSMIGDGPMRESLHMRAEELGISDRVTFHGILPDASRFLQAFDVFAMSSRSEGTPMVLLEAMAAGVPIVVTAVGGIPDVVSSKEAQLVREDTPGNSVSAALAQALRPILAAGPEVAQRTDAARIKLETAFGVAPWLDQYEALYRAIQHLHHTS